ncbi:energy transducer TonB [Pseudomonas izuensis]|uniref:energy transducer TonB n=1 Tax=Pseudomonas izuensis TaxID=2684212 RepID=UPI00135A812B|nr:energy transducer TonB [Pseudomonas izuensis]
MRWVVCVVLLLVLSVESRADVFLIPEYNPRPVYSLELQRTGIIGDVRVGFTVHADGSVSKVSILQSDHPDLAEATRVAISQWRFKPWTVEGDKPSEQDVIAPMKFGFDVYLSIDFNQRLKELKCRDINEAFVRLPEHKRIDAAPFHYTRAYLSNACSKATLSDERRLALIAKMNRMVPTIVRQCLSSPGSRYSRFLPKDIRELL